MKKKKKNKSLTKKLSQPLLTDGLSLRSTLTSSPPNPVLLSALALLARQFEGLPWVEKIALALVQVSSLSFADKF